MYQFYKKNLVGIDLVICKYEEKLIKNDNLLLVEYIKTILILLLKGIISFQKL